MKKIKQEQVAKFAGLVAKVWSDKELARKYETDPQKVLAEYGVALPSGVPTPTIPPRPKGFGTAALGEEFKHLSFENWELTVHELPGEEAIATGGTTTSLRISSLACYACPVSSFSSLSN